MGNVTTKTCAPCPSISRKQLVGVTGLALSLFVLTHMAGNLLILVSAQKYNEYSHALVTNPFLFLAEAALLAAFLAHLAIALRLARSNRVARGSRYAVLANGAKGTSPVQRSLWVQGLVILVFVILHLTTFKYGPHYEVNYGAGPIRDLHRLAIEVFSQPGYVAWYLVALVVLGLHLSHGVGSTFQTLGLNHPRYNCLIKVFGRAYALIVTAGFLSQPIYVFFFHRG